jgi:DNA-binding HxlR family transcriptional regulator
VWTARGWTYLLRDYRNRGNLKGHCCHGSFYVCLLVRRRQMQLNQEKRIAYLYPKVMEAIANPTRQEILVFLEKSGKEKLPFTEIKRRLGLKNSSTLAHHLNMLQRAWLVERTTDLSSPRTAKDPYYCFYSLTPLGRQVTQRTLPHVKEVLEDALPVA